MKMKFLNQYRVNILSILIAAGTTSGIAIAAMPSAGSIIGNQASAQYTIDGQVFKVTSNLVQTIIAKKAALTLSTDQTKLGAPGSTVYFPHVVTNVGNTPDTYDLTSAVTSGGLTNVVFYPDMNSDGIPDSSTPITSTPVLVQGETYNLIAAANVPASAAIPGSGGFTLTATSQLDNTQTQTNTDTITFTNKAIVNVNKTMTPSNPAPGDTVTITLTYTNVGGMTSGEVTLTDPLPTGMTYTAGSGLWSNSGTTAMTDAAGGDPAGIDYSYASATVNAVISSVDAGVTGRVTFNATVNATAPAGNIVNIATVTCDCDPTTPGPDKGPDPTNPAIIDVKVVNSVNLSDTASTTDSGTGTTPGNDIVEVPGPAAAGSVVMFDNVVINTGNAIDTFNMSLSGSNFPAGTAFTLTKADGVTPLTDTNNDGVIDTGPVAIGGTYHVFVRVQLPADASGSGPFNVTKTATSVTDPTKSDTVTDRLVGGITAATMDLTNSASGTDAGTGTDDDGWGAGPETVSQTTVTTTPNTTVDFNLFIHHRAGVLATYVLEYSTSSTFATVNTLPAGWGVTFYNSSNAAISTATVAGMTGATATQFAYTAKVTVPAGTLAGNYPIYFRARSTSLGLSDVKFDQVTVSQVHDVAMTPTNIGQVFAGSSKVYVHALTNLGNVTETSGAISVTSSVGNWNTVAYLDSNNNGVFDAATDVVFTNISQIAGGLAPGATQTFFMVVQSPASALPGDSQIATVSVAVAGETNTSNNSTTDQTTVLSGSISLLKRQAPDVACDGTADSAFTVDEITTIKPNECVMYEVTATNVGLSPVTSLDILDQIPQYSTLLAAPTVGGTAASGSVVSAPAAGGTGQIKASWPTVNASQTGILFFNARINNN